MCEQRIDLFILFEICIDLVEILINFGLINFVIEFSTRRFDFKNCHDFRTFLKMENGF